MKINQQTINLLGFISGIILFFLLASCSENSAPTENEISDTVAPVADSVPVTNIDTQMQAKSVFDSIH